MEENVEPLTKDSLYHLEDAYSTSLKNSHRPHYEFPPLLRTIINGRGLESRAFAHIMLELVNFRCLHIHCACLNLRILVGRFVKCQVVGRYAEGVPLSINISVLGGKNKVGKYS